MSKQVLLLILFSIILCSLASSVPSIGVVKPHLNDNTLKIDANKSSIIVFELQNTYDTQKSIMVTMSYQSPLKINNQLSSYSTTLGVDSGSTRDLPINISSIQTGIYKVDYKVTEVAPSGQQFQFSISGSFYVNIGNSNTSIALGIPLVYQNYRLIVDGDNISDVDLLVQGNYMEVDFLSRMNLTGFKEQYIKTGPKYVYVNSSAIKSANQTARITFYNIKSIYTVYRDGVVCEYPQCREIDYKNKRLTIEVKGFSEYSVQDRDPSTTTTSSSGGTSGGTKILNVTKLNTTKTNTTAAKPTNPTKPVTKVEERPVSQAPVVMENKPIQPRLEKEEENILQEDAAPGAKVLLISMLVTQGIILILAASLLVWYYRKMGGEK